LIDDRVDRHGGFAGLAVADDQFALSAADRYHRVDGFEPGLQRFFHRLAVDDTGSDRFDRQIGIGDDVAFSVDGIAERVNHAADHRLPDGHAHDASGALDGVAFTDLLRVAEEHRADLVFFQVQRQPAHVVRKLDKFAGHDLFQAVDLRNTVADLDDCPDFGHGHAGVKIFDLLTNKFVYLVSFNCFHSLFNG
jgi:hypothetical protein